MKFDELDEKLRVFETANDRCVLPELFMVARIDGRGFTRLTKETFDFERPFDVRVRDMMVATTEHLMTCGFRVLYGYTQSDEISLLLARDEATFGRKVRKYLSVLAGEASAKFSLLLGAVAVFDCRLSELPTAALVRDYFRWRNEDANRNALNAQCYWSLRKQGASARDASEELLRQSVAQKNEFLFQQGINFNELPNWQKRGVGVYWVDQTIEAQNPKTGERVLTERRRLKTDFDLPMKDAYGDFVLSLVDEAR